MSPKTAVYIGAFIGSSIGGFIPVLWGGSVFSYSSVFLTAIGGLIGVYITFRLVN